MPTLKPFVEVFTKPFLNGLVEGAIGRTGALLTRNDVIIKTTPTAESTARALVKTDVRNASDDLVGEFTFVVKEHADDTRSIYVQGLDLDGQQKGLGTAIVQHAEDAWRSIGARQARLTTENIGGYFWPKMGYDFDIPKTGAALVQARHAKVVEMVEHAKRMNTIDGDQYARLRAALDADPLGPGDAIRGAVDLAKHPDGKSVLKHSVWDGIKQL